MWFLCLNRVDRFFLKDIYFHVFIWLYRVLVTTWGIFSLHCGIRNLAVACGLELPDQGWILKESEVAQLYLTLCDARL